MMKYRNKQNYLFVKFFGLHLQNNGSVVLDLLCGDLHKHAQVCLFITQCRYLTRCQA